MRTRDLLLAAAALGLALAGAGTLELLRQSPEADPVALDEIGAMSASAEMPGHARETELDEPQRPERQALGDSLPEVEVEEPPLEPGQTAVRVFRWPDRELLARREVTVRVLPGLVPLKLRTSARGRVLLPEDHAGAEEFLYVEAEGFERGKVELQAPGAEPRSLEVALVPTEGWYGRVIDHEGEPLSGKNVRGWWAETPRPLASAPEGGVLSRSLARLLEPEVTRSAIRGGEKKRAAFFSARGPVEATRSTTENGWYYLEALPGELSGKLGLFVHDASVASEVRRTDLPALPPLPDIVVQPQLFVQGIVVDREDRSIEGVRIFSELPERGAPQLFETTSNEHGAFSLPVLSGGTVYIGAERTGFRLAEPQVFKAASADRMWASVRRLGGDDAALRRRFHDGYGQWASPLPRARGFVRGEHGAADVKIVLQPVGASVLVSDAKTKRPLPDARITLLTSTHDTPRMTTTMTDAEGSASVSLPDLAWNPVLVRVESPGYVSAERLFPVGKDVLHVRLLAEGTTPELPPGESIRLVVRSENGKTCAGQAAAYVQVGNRFRLAAKGTSGRDGRVELAVGRLEPHELVYAYAWSGHGERLAAGGVGPYSRGNLLAHAELDVTLEASAPFSVVVRGLPNDRPHRLKIGLGPVSKMPPVEHEWFDIPSTHLNEWRTTFWAPLDWEVRGNVWAAIEHARPTPDFTRPFPQADYTSTRSQWATWGAVTEGIEARGFGVARVLDITLTGLISFGGRVVGIAPNAYGSCTVAAKSDAGDWTVPVDLHGTFVFENMPSGKYTLVLYATPSPEDATDPLFSTTVFDRISVFLHRSRHDLRFEVEAEDD